MKIGFLFAGQGAQYVGMGKELYDKYDSMKKVLDEINIDFDVKKVCFEGPEEILNDTAYTQSCLVAISLGMAKILNDDYGIKANMCAGLSLGEYSALAYANSISNQEAVKLVRKRGELMANALPQGTGKMAAVLNLDAKTIEDICNKVDGVAQIANYNCPGQIVVTGETNAIDQVCEKVIEAGARRAIPLKVSGAFHSSLLNEASCELKQELDKITINQPSIPVVYNYTAKDTCEDLKDNLQKQMCNSVRFEESIRLMIDKGIDTFIEIGPGRTLSGFVKKISKEVTVLNVEDETSLLKTIAQIKGE